MITHNIDHIEKALRNEWTFVLLRLIKDHPDMTMTYYVEDAFPDDKSKTRSRMITLTNLCDIGLVKSNMETDPVKITYSITASGEYTLKCWEEMIINIHLKNRIGIN